MQPSMEAHAYAHLSHPAVPHVGSGLGLVGQNSSYIHDMEHKQIMNSSEIYDDQEMEGD